MAPQDIVTIFIEGFRDFKNEFIELSVNAKQRFDQKKWREQRTAMQQRMDLHDEFILKIKNAIKDKIDFGGTGWKTVEQLFLNHFQSDSWLPLAASFFNTALRQTHSASSLPLVIPVKVDKSVKDQLSAYPIKDNLSQAIQKAVLDFQFQAAFTNLFSQSKKIEQLILGQVKANAGTLFFYKNLFYRNKHAYALGKLETENKSIPFGLAMINTEIGISINAVLLQEEQLKNIFSFSRSYFLVNSTSPIGLLNFLLSVIPSKPQEQLLINLGFQELGKELLLQKIINQTRDSCEKFIHAPGIPGMVMIVFTHPVCDFVFKVVRGNVKPPKNSTEEEVIEKYRFVAHHDRAGRMADVQHFTNMTLPADQFAESLKNELLELAPNCVKHENNLLIFKTIFIERKLVPLNLYLQDQTEKEKTEAIVDYGQSIKEMVMTNIFPGDLLLKNFGVTPEKKVVFYDYDEVVPLVDCTFKKLHKSYCDEDEFYSEYSEPVMENDIFPEELLKFLIPEGNLRQEFLRLHADLFHVDFWNRWKQVHLEGSFIDLQPYDANLLD